MNFIFVMGARAILGSSHSRPRRRFYSGEGRKRIDAPQEAAPSVAPRRRASVASSGHAGWEWNPDHHAGPAKTAGADRGSSEGTRAAPRTIPRGGSNHLPPVSSPSVRIAEAPTPLPV